MSPAKALAERGMSIRVLPTADHDLSTESSSWMVSNAASQKILVVEDDPSIAELIGWVLNDAGFTVYKASTVTAALKQYREVNPDLVVADLILPDGLGSDLVTHLRSQAGTSSAATLMMSAHPRATEHARAAGADACLPKPFDLDEFYRTVTRLVGSMDEPNRE
jgi:DNA-binding response OmpR family regulator